jgi:hypothetical protein
MSGPSANSPSIIHKPPDQISDEELRQYFLFVKNVKHWSRSGTTIALCGLKFFYEHTLQRSLATLQLVRPPREKKRRSSSAGKKCDRFSRTSNGCASGLASPPFSPAGCAYRKALTFKPATLTVLGS